MTRLHNGRRSNGEPERIDGQYGPTMPRESLQHFVNDLSGVVDLPPSGDRRIDAVTSGRAELLGKGDDGLAFKVGRDVVKVSTTVPYQPTNPGHRSPAQAAKMLEQQAALGNRLADGGAAVQRSEFVRHGDKGFQIKPYVEIPDRWTQTELDEIQDAVIAMHEQGYSLNDDVQAGREYGRIVLFDVGKAEPSSGEGIWSSVKSDMDNLRRLYEASGGEFVRRDVDEGEQEWRKVEEALARAQAGGRSAAYLAKPVERAAAMRRKVARARLHGAALEKRLADIDEAETFALEDAGVAKRANRGNSGALTPLPLGQLPGARDFREHFAPRVTSGVFAVNADGDEADLLRSIGQPVAGTYDADGLYRLLRALVAVWDSGAAEWGPESRAARGGRDLDDWRDWFATLALETARPLMRAMGYEWSTRMKRTA